MSYYSPNVPGSAYTFRPSMPKPVEVIDRFNKEETARRAAQAAAEREQTKENQKNLLEFLKYSPESTIKEYDSEIKRRLNEEFIPFVANIHRGGRIPSVDEMAEIRKRQNDIELLVEKQKAIRENLDGVLAQVKNDKEINQDWVYQQVEDFIYENGEEGNKKLRDLESIDPEQIKRILESPEAYNIDAVVSNFSDNIGENIDTYIREGGGSTRPWRESKEVKSKYLVLDETGEPVLDDNGNYVLNLTPNTLKMALNNPRMEKAIEQEVVRMSAETGGEVTRMEAFRNLMAPKAYANATTKRTNATVKDDEGSRNTNFIFGDRKLHNETEARYDSIGRLLMKRDEQELERIVGGDIKNAMFTNIHPETRDKFDTPHLVLYVKNNETTETELETESGDAVVKKKNKETGSTAQVFDLSNDRDRERAMYLINRNMTKNNGSKITDDHLRAYINHLSQSSRDALYQNKYGNKQQAIASRKTTSTGSKRPSFQPGR